MTDEEIARAFYDGLVSRFQDAHLTVQEALPDIVVLIKAVRRTERERCAMVNVLGKKKDTSEEYEIGWFDGVEDTLDAILNADQPGA
jgi:hypothetical protein